MDSNLPLNNAKSNLPLNNANNIGYMIFIVIILGIIIFAVYSVYSTLSNSPFGKAISDAFGLCDSVLGFMSSSISTCVTQRDCSAISKDSCYNDCTYNNNTNVCYNKTGRTVGSGGFFDSKCMWFMGGIGFIGFIAFSKILSTILLFRQNKNNAIDKIAEKMDTSYDKIVEKMLPDFKEEYDRRIEEIQSKFERSLNDIEAKYIADKVINDKVVEKLTDILESSNITDSAKAEAIADAKSYQSEKQTEINNEVDENPDVNNDVKEEIKGE